jgi:hypothetical protein
MLRNLYRGLAGAIVAVSLAGCGGDEVTTMPATPPPLSSEMQDLKAQIIQKQKDRLAHHSGPGANRYSYPRRR